MARIIGGIAASHTPTIGFAYDRNKRDDPVWAPIFENFAPPFAKQYAQLGRTIVRAAKDYANDVREGLFPKSTPKQTSDLAGRRVIPSLNDRAFEELKGARLPVR